MSVEEKLNQAKGCLLYTSWNAAIGDWVGKREEK